MSKGPSCRTCGPLEPSVVVYREDGDHHEVQLCPFCGRVLLIWEKRSK